MKKRILAVFLSVTLLMTSGNVFSVSGLTGATSLDVVASLEVHDITIMDGADGWMDGDYFRYNLHPSYTVTFKNGDIVTSNEQGMVMYESIPYYLQVSDTQNVSHWVAGNTYDAIGYFMGKTDAFQVTVAESPVESVVIQDITVMEGTDGWIDGDYFRYEPRPSYKVTFKNGDIVNSDAQGTVMYDDMPYSLQFSDTQNDTHWMAGNTYVSTGNFMGKTDTFEVTVTESPVASIAIEDATIMEYTEGILDGDYYRYEPRPFYTVTFKNNDVVDSDEQGEIEYEGQRYRLSFSDTQRDEHWTAGHSYDVTGVLMGATDTFQVTVTESPVESIVIQDVTVMEGTEGWMDGDYFRYEPRPSYTVTFKNGDVVTSDEQGWVMYDDMPYSLQFSDTQYDAHWMAGNTYESTGNFMGKADIFEVTVTESPVESIVIQDVTVIEGTDGWVDGDYYRYEPRPSYTVTFRNGDIVNSDAQGVVMYDNVPHLLQFSDTQHDTHWMAGNTYESTGNFMGKIDTFQVTVAESPVESIVVQDVTVMEGTDGWRDGDYYRYEPQPSYTVTFKNGHVVTSDEMGTVMYEDNPYSLNVTDTQQDTHWTAGGTYEAIGNFMGATDTFSVNITESPAASIDIRDITVVEGADGFLDSMTGKFRYCFSPEFTITYKGGLTDSSNGFGFVMYDGATYSVSYTDTQFDEPWTAGNSYELTGICMGAADTFRVTVVENPVKSVSIDDVTIIEGTSGFGDETGFHYDFSPEFTITFKDDTVRKSTDGMMTIGNSMVSVFDNATQDSEPWTVGNTYYLEGEVMGATDTFSVSIVESPVQSVTIEDAMVMDHMDGWNELNAEHESIFIYDVRPNFSVKLKDGTVCYPDEEGGVQIGEQYYYLNILNEDQYVNPWALHDTKEVTGEFLGKYYTFHTTVVENPYSGLTISGTHELTLTLNKKDGQTEEMKIVGFDERYGDAGVRGGILRTDKAVFNHAEFTFYEPENGDAQMDKDVAVRLGSMCSNTLSSCPWLKVQSMMTTASMSVDRYYNYCLDNDRFPFDGYDTSAAGNAIDALVSLAVDINGAMFEAENHVTIGGMECAVLTVNTVREAVESVFGVTGIDVTQAAQYNPEKPDELAVPFYSRPVSIGGYTLSYADGLWIYTYVPDQRLCVDCFKITITANEQMQIQSIRLTKHLPGDVNGDSLVNLTDVVSLARVKAGWENEPVVVNAVDINGDGAFTLKDVTYLAQHLAGWENHPISDISFTGTIG